MFALLSTVHKFVADICADVKVLNNRFAPTGAAVSHA